MYFFQKHIMLEAFQINISQCEPTFIFHCQGSAFAHKIVLLTASSRFQSMLNYRLSSSSANGNGEPPILQINDIRYDVFALVMNYLYNGSASCLKVENSDLLELMAAGMYPVLHPFVDEDESKNFRSSGNCRKPALAVGSLASLAGMCSKSRK